MKYLDFELDGIRLSSFGGKIIYYSSLYEEDISPNITVISNSNSNEYDGETVSGSKVNPIEIELDILIEGESCNEQSLQNWLNKKGKRKFNYVGSDKFIEVVRTDKVTIKYHNMNQRTIENLKFIAYEPYWKLINPNKFICKSPVIDNLYEFKNVGDIESKPIICLECNDEEVDIQFEVNNIRYKLDNIIYRTFIDCDYEKVYNIIIDETVNLIRKYSCINEGKFRFTFPALNIGVNTFKLIKGNLTNATIDCNSRFY